MPDPDVILWGIAVRAVQVFVEAAPTILCGVLVAGVLRRMVGAAGVRRAFGGTGWGGIARGWTFGMLLPVCSVGVIPVARELRRAGVPGGTVLAFVLVAPLLNPISFLYGLTLSEPVVILTFAAVSLVLALVVGEVWDFLYPSDPAAVPVADEPLPAPGLKRLLAVAVGVGREAVGPVMLFCLVAAVGSGLLALIPFGALQSSMHYPDGSAPLQMAALATPAFNSPLNGMMKIGLMFDHGNSVGAAFVLFVLGLGLNVGVVAWLATLYGWRRTGVWLGTTVGAAVLIGYALQVALPKPARAEDHTHAFDEFSNPFPASMDVTAEAARQKVLQRAEGPELLALPVLGGFVLLGLLDRAARRRWDVDGWLARRPDRTTGVGKYDVTIPGPVLGVIVIAGLVVFSIAGAYTYYPPPNQALTDIHRLRADVAAAMAGARSPRAEEAARRRTEAIRELEQTDLAVRKLMVGVYIREYRLTPEQESAAEDLREHIEHVRDALLAGKADEAYGMRTELDAAFRACRAAYVGTE